MAGFGIFVHSPIHSLPQIHPEFQILCILHQLLLHVCPVYREVYKVLSLQVLSEKEYRDAYDKYGNTFRVGMGAEAIKECVKTKMELFGSVGKAC